MYCMDTYALIEIIMNNKEFLQYTEKKFVVPDWTMVEFYRTVLKKYDVKTADYWFKKFGFYVKNVPIEMLLKATIFQHENRKNNLSLFDCVGYIFSLENNYRFVTGDKEFRNLKEVEFIR